VELHASIQRSTVIDMVERFTKLVEERMDGELRFETTAFLQNHKSQWSVEVLAGASMSKNLTTNSGCDTAPRCCFIFGRTALELSA
jgi:hypothetical protein